MELEETNLIIKALCECLDDSLIFTEHPSTIPGIFVSVLLNCKLILGY